MPALAAKGDCTGCTACGSICSHDCITMKADEYGFLYPVVDNEKCISCGLCEKSCPIIKPLKIAQNEPVAYAAYSKDKEMRLSSSSGGIFTEIAKAVLQQGGVVYGAAYNMRFEVVHICAENEEDLAKLRGAKYAQSDIRGVFVQIKQKLKGGQKVLFSGTPCQMGGLKAFLCKEYTNLITVDFVCHSVPSPMAWCEYVKYRAEQDNAGELPVAINLRSKKTGWSRYQYSNLFEYANGSTYIEKSSENLYMKLFMGGYINRESCGNCHFKGYSHVSDLTIGDFWGIWDIAPEMDDDKGTSVVLVQSVKGTELLGSVSDRLEIRQVALKEASQQNHAMLENAVLASKRVEILDLIHYRKMSECNELLPTPKPVRRNRLRSFVGRILRKISVHK